MQPLLLFVCISALSAVNCAKYVGSESMYYELELAEEIFAEFVEYYGHNYDVNEYEQRLETFKHNLETINRNNERDNAPNFGLTPFTAMTFAEFKATMTGLKRNKGINGKKLDTSGFDEDIPDSFDWRDQNVLTPIKDQRPCGSCWAFSTTATLESQNAIKNKKLISLSEQQLVDCYGISCAGPAFIDSGFQFVNKTGIMTEKNYPYLAKDQTCQFDKHKVVLSDSQPTYYENVTTVKDLQKLLVHYGPFTVGIFVTRGMIYFNGKGIYDDKDSECPEMFFVDHAINLVGYGTENGTDYWIMRNSWGTDWGDQGYAKISRKLYFCNVGREVATAEVIAV